MALARSVHNQLHFCCSKVAIRISAGSKTNAVLVLLPIKFVWEHFTIERLQGRHLVPSQVLVSLSFFKIEQLHEFLILDLKSIYLVEPKPISESLSLILV